MGKINFCYEKIYLKLETGWAQRHFNEGASGGEKKKNELLQLLHINPKLVILDCAAPVTVAALPETLPVTFPVNGPAKASEVTVPSK